VPKLQSAVNDLHVIINNLAGQTPIAKATFSILKKNPTSAALLVEKLRAAINRVIAEPQETKYHKIRLDKLWHQTGVVDGGTEFIRLFGFEVDVVSQIAKLYPGLDVNLLKLRSEDLTRSWETALATARQRRAEKGIQKIQLD